MFYTRHFLAPGLAVLLLVVLWLGQSHASATLYAADLDPKTSNSDAPAQISVNVCGPVVAYTPPIYNPPLLNIPGSLTIGAQVFAIAANATISGDGLLTPLNNVCVIGTLNGQNQLVSLTVTQAPTSTPSPTTEATNTPIIALPTLTLTLPVVLPTLTVTLPPVFPTNTATSEPGQATPTPSPTVGVATAQPTETATPGVGSTIRLCGVVSGYVPATALTVGSLTIGGQTLVLAPGTILDGAALLRQGANVCVDLTLSLTGSVLSGQITPNVGAAVSVCGVVTDFRAATSTSPGSITINGQTIPIAAGVNLDSQNLIRPGADLCLTGQLNAFGELGLGGVTLNAGGSVNICGVVTAFQAATASAPGSITIGGQTFSIATGTQLVGQDNVRVGSQYCLDANLNAQGRISGGSITANATGGASVNVCGAVTAFQAATANAPGSITIGGQTFPIAVGATLIGQDTIRTGDNFCLSGTLNANGQLRDGAITANAGGSVSVCGRVTAFAPATANAPGSVTIGGQTIPIAVGAVLQGQNLLTTGNDVCLNGALNANGQLSNGTVTANATGGANIQLCGVLTAFQAATANAPGSITIGGQTFPIAVNTVLDGQELLTLGNDVCLSATLNANGQINNGQVTANVGGSLEVCGVVTAFTPASASAPGSITIGGQTFPIAAGTTLVGQNLVNIGDEFCLQGGLNASGQINNGQITVDASGRLCGVVDAISNTSITIDGRVITLAPNVDIGPGVGACASVCVEINSAGQAVRVSADIAATVTGRVDAFVPGVSITVNGQTLPLAPNARLDANIGVGSQVTLSLNGAGQVVCGTGTPGPGTGTPGPGTGTPGAGTGTPGPGTGTPGAGTPTATATSTPRSSPTAQPGTINICGTVYDAVTRQPIPGATVELFNAQGGRESVTTTGANGTYCFYNVPPGDYTAVGTHPNYNPDSRTFTAPPGQPTTVDLTLQPRQTGAPQPTRTPTATPGPGATPTTGTVCAYVTNEGSGAPLAGAVVEIFDENGFLVGRGLTESDGHVCIPNVPAGPQTVVARVLDCPGALQCSSRLARVTVTAGQAIRVDLPLACRSFVLYLPLIERRVDWNAPPQP